MQSNVSSIIGRIGLFLKGEFNADSFYIQNDKVDYKGSSFIKRRNEDRLFYKPDINDESSWQCILDARINMKYTIKVISDPLFEQSNLEFKIGGLSEVFSDRIESFSYYIRGANTVTTTDIFDLHKIKINDEVISNNDGSYELVTYFNLKNGYMSKPLVIPITVINTGNFRNSGVPQDAVITWNDLRNHIQYSALYITESSENTYTVPIKLTTEFKSLLDNLQTSYTEVEATISGHNVRVIDHLGTTVTSPIQGIVVISTFDNHDFDFILTVDDRLIRGVDIPVKVSFKYIFTETESQYNSPDIDIVLSYR